VKTLLLFLLLLLPSAALADSTFNISCKNIASIHIMRISGAKFTSQSYPGTFHVVYFKLKLSATEEFRRLVKASRSVFIHSNGIDSDREKLIITANGKPLRNDVPDCDAHEEGEVGIMILREQDAFDAARTVCPALVPTEVITYGPVATK